MIRFDPDHPATLTINGQERHLTPGAIRAFRLLHATPNTIVPYQRLNGAIHATVWLARHPQGCPPEPHSATQSLYDVISELRGTGLHILACHGRGYSWIDTSADPRPHNPEADA
jgi:hypothetical protein